MSGDFMFVNNAAVNGVAEWLGDPDPSRFPYDDVVAEYQRVGKHFVADDLLKALSTVRDGLDTWSGTDAAASLMLIRFLSTALDKWDGRYDYPTYIALDVLALPNVDDPPDDPAAALARRDRMTVGLLADALGFELAVAEGRTQLLPEQRPPVDLPGKRYRLGLKVATPALYRLGLGAAGTAENPGGQVPRITVADLADSVRRLCAVVDGELSPDECRTLQLSMLPVYLSHDEYLFIRVLQLFETTFTLLAIQLRAAVIAMADDDWPQARSRLDVASSALGESAPLFSLLATMQVESFRTFREFTSGASAIQSRGYKVVESLCRTPDPQRLNSLAYLSVPEVRERVLAGQATMDEVFTAARAAGRIPAADQEALVAAMRRFSDTLLRWRQTHYRLAVRMLGERSGTGYTEGTPYLREVRTIPVFRSLTSPDLALADSLEGARTGDPH
jgi:tryptophan 2,3-dioxygenase